MVRGPVDYRISEGVIFHHVSNGTWAAWNRFSPSVVIMSEIGAAWLDEVRNRHEVLSEENIQKDQLEVLIQNRLVYEGDQDSFRAQFYQNQDDAMSEVNRVTEEFQRGNRSYEHLQITNSVCNLGCSYCICSHNNDFQNVRVTKSYIDSNARFSALCRLVDQFVTRRTSINTSPVRIFFNGGEILLDWKLIQPLILYLKGRYSDTSFVFSMNTNMTLITEDIAKFLAEHKINLDISIDGYEESHNRSRIYKGAKYGQSSFSDVMRGIKTYNEERPDAPIQTYQGTIANVAEFDENLFFLMSQKGFTEARLAPNLLKGDPSLGENAARLIARMHRLSRRRKMKFVDLQINKMSKMLSAKDYQFQFFCQAMAGNNIRSLNINLTSFDLSQVCSFIPAGRIRVQDVNENIYHPMIFKAADDFVSKRNKALKTVCGDCELLGICRGGCIMNGLGVDNSLNDTACAFQKTLWHELLVNSLEQNGRPRNKARRR